MTAPDIHLNVLDNLTDGVLVVAPGGRIETLNPAAERILSLAPGTAVGQSFAELFVARDGFDELTQVVLDAAAERSSPERRVVEVESDGASRSLTVTISYFERTEGGSGQSSVIAVFSDITELRELRDSELRMARAAEEQHGRLQSAYREIEDSNAALAAALRKVRLTQSLGIVLVMGLFLGVGLLNWRPQEQFGEWLADLGLFQDTAASAAGDGDGPALRTVTVKPQPVSSSIVLRGRLAPWREADVKSPVQGAVKAVHFQEGQEVGRGDVLVEFDLAPLKRRHQSQRLKFLRARERFRTVTNWERSPEMTTAKRAYTKAQLAMEGQRNNIRKSRFLFEQGLIAAAEHEDAERQHKGQLLDFEAAKEAFDAVTAKGGPEAETAARLAMENVRTDLLEVEAQLEQGRILAPLAGVVLPPQRGRKQLGVGDKVRKDQPLFRIGDFSRIAAAAQADEIDVVKLRAGQKVAVTGNAFPGLTLKGIVERVSAQADPGSRGKAVFEVSVVLDPLAREEQARLRTGMSARLRIVTYSNPKALLVPLEAVRRRGGRHWLRVLDAKTRKPADREVAIGPTTPRRVEIASGLKPGEAVVLSGG